MNKLVGKHNSPYRGVQGSAPGPKKDPTKVTTKMLQDLLPQVLDKVRGHYQTKPRAVIGMWPQIIGKELASMTKAVRFEAAILYVQVKNSTLLSLLNNPVDKQKILQTIRHALPAISISNIVFRIG